MRSSRMSLMIGPKIHPKEIKLANRRRFSRDIGGPAGYTVDRYAGKRGYDSCPNGALRMPLQLWARQNLSSSGTAMPNTLKVQTEQGEEIVRTYDYLSRFRKYDSWETRCRCPPRRIAGDTLENLPANGWVPADCIVEMAGVRVLCGRISLACLRKIARVSESPKSSEPAEEKTTTYS